MDDPNIKPEDAGTEHNEPDKKLDDIQIENNALKQLLAENKKTIEELTKTLNEVKTTNAKLVNSLDVSGHQKSVEDIINENFNKYFKKGN
jgi:predicted RNase H-like nuclease (RuvC/YqgF family)